MDVSSPVEGVIRISLIEGLRGVEGDARAEKRATGGQGRR
jgi:hypothetical protein